MNEPIWLSVARMAIGVREVAGPANNPVVMQWAKDIGAPAWYDNDDKPWCAVFMNRLLMACQLPMSGTGFELLRAKSFETWGDPIDVPSPGCVMTFSRPEGAHVFLYLGENATAYYGIGGNQSNAVNATWVAKARLTSIRWPTGFPVHGGRVWLDATGALSTNEQ